MRCRLAEPNKIWKLFGTGKISQLINCVCYSFTNFEFAQQTFKITCIVKKKSLNLYKRWVKIN